MAIIDLSSGQTILPDLIEVANGGGYSSAAAAYTSWAATYGLPSAATVSSFDSDDGSTLLDLGFAPLLGSTETRIAIAGETGIQFFKSPITNSTNSGITISVDGVIISRMHGPAAPAPSVLFAIKPDAQDSGVGSSKWQKATNVAIVFFQCGAYQTRTATDVALRIKPGSVEFVITVNTAESQKFSQVRFLQADGNLVADSAMYIKTALSQTTAYISQQAYVISGNVKAADGSFASRTVRAYNRSSGALEATTTSDASTGAYSLTVFGAGERNVVCLDDAAGDVLNDVILRTTPT